MLACLLSTIIRVRGVTVRGMCVMGGLFVRILLMILGRLAMMLRSVLVMFRCFLMMLYYLLLGHGGVPSFGVDGDVRRLKYECQATASVAQGE
jgi:hypothetical protein